MEQKKYRVLKEVRFNNGLWTVNGVYKECAIQPFDVNALVNQGYIEEVGTDTLESILNRNITNKQIAVSQCKYEVKQYIIKQKIELLKEVLSHKCSFENIGGQWIGKVVIDDKISELEKERGINFDR